MMKKCILILMACLLLCLACVACDGSADPITLGTPYVVNPGASQAATATPGQSPSAQAPTATPTQGYQPQGEANYTVKLDPNVEYWDCPITQVGQVFTHSLIAYLEMTDLATNPESYFRNECVTVDEFNRFLESVYEKGYVLINMNYIYEYKEDADGVLRAYLKKSIKLPKGKKGLIFSVDDVTYSPYQQYMGRVDKLVIHEGKIASSTKLKDGTVDIAYDKEVVPIIEQFCEAHPDFSFAGAKCMLAVNGREGILGYRTASKFAGQYDIEAERKAAKEVVAYLLNNGFYFGCHGIAHKDISTMSVAELETEFNTWNTEVKPLIGYTSIYVYPQGAWADYGTAQHDRLLAEGFHVFVGTFMGECMMNGMPKSPNVGNIFTQRCILQGNTLRLHAEKGKAEGTWFWRYCDPYEIYDNSVRYHKLTKPA